MGIGFVTAIIFLVLILVMLSGIPLAFGFGATMVLLTLWQMGPGSLYLIVSTAYSNWSGYLLLAIPLFVLMAKFLQHSGLAEDMYDAIYKWMGRVPGGLAVGTIFICAVFGAMSGMSGAATVSMGLIALPSMLRRGYNKRLAVGTVAAGGSLGVLLPPSITMIIYAGLTNMSVGKMFMAGVIPGIILTIIYMLQVGLLCWFKPQYGPPVPPEERVSLKEKVVSLKGVVMPFGLIVLVLGGIYTGICTPTEAAGIGAGTALLVTILHGKLTWQVFYDSLAETLTLSVMIMWIVFGAKCFVHIYTATGAGDLVGESIGSLPVNKWFIVIVMQMIITFLGCFIDPIGIMTITVPVFVPIIESFGMDPIWYGVLLTINLEMAYITPPIGINLLYLKSIVPPEVTMYDLYRSVIPFVLRDIAAMALIMIFPSLALWLPNHLK